MHAAVLSVLIGLLLVMRSDAVTTPSSQCAYLTYYFPYNPGQLLQSLVPSISSKCLATYNPADRASICTADCQSAYTLYAQCTTPSSTEADSYVGVACGRFNSTSCTTLTQNYPDYYILTNAVSSQCSNSTYCSTNCSAAIAALEQYGGCCNADVLNGPKVVCGQQPIAPCSTVLNSGSVATPTSECVYASSYSPAAAVASNRLSSVGAECKKRLAAITDDTTDFTPLCIADCKSYFDFYGRCYGIGNSDYLASFFCGTFNNQKCSNLTYSTNGRTLATGMQTACSNSTSCSSSCVNAIAALEQYGGCCYADYLNGPKVLCGQQPIAPCSTIVSSSSTTINLNLLIVMIAMVVAALGVYF